LLLTIDWRRFFSRATLASGFLFTKRAAAAMRGLVALVFLFDLYTIYQHLLIYRIRRQLINGKLFT